MGGLSLRARQDHGFAAAVEAIYDAATDPSLWPHALQKLADCFDDVGGVLIWRREDGSFGTVVSPRLEAAQRDYVREWWRHDIRAQRSTDYGFRTHSGAITDRHLISLEEMETHPIYTEFLARHGLRWTAGVDISPDPSMPTAISLQRAPTREPFSDAELEALTRLGRHAEKALRLSIRLFDAELMKTGLGQALAHVGIGVFALDALGRVVYANPAGETLLGDAVAIVDGRLRIGLAEQRIATDAAIHGMLMEHSEDRFGDPKPILVPRASSNRPLVLYLLPVGTQTRPADHFLKQTRAIVLLVDSRPSDPPDPAVVRDLLGLTLGEARVASTVGSGLPPRQAAEKLGISEETVRTTLKRVFSKIGVSRQSELALLLTKLALK